MASLIHDAQSEDEVHTLASSRKTSKLTIASGSQARLEVLGTIPLPQEIMSEVSNITYGSRGGLLPEINRAYITMDSKLFLWDLSGTYPVVKFEDVNQFILGVCLFKPKPGMLYISFIDTSSNPLWIIGFFAVFFCVHNYYTSSYDHTLYYYIISIIIYLFIPLMYISLSKYISI